MSDLFVLLLAPGGGDELQGVKRGIMEIADLILVNKADGDLKSTAMRTVADYAGALRLLRKREGDPEDFPKAMAISSLEESGLDAAWGEMTALADHRKSTGFWDQRRADQARRWFEDEVRQGLLKLLQKDRRAEAAMADLGEAVAEGHRAPGAAAREVLGLLATGQKSG